jgi:hypothetical protein
MDIRLTSELIPKEPGILLVNIRAGRGRGLALLELRDLQESPNHSRRSDVITDADRLAISLGSVGCTTSGLRSSNCVVAGLSSNVILRRKGHTEGDAIPRSPIDGS